MTPFEKADRAKHLLEDPVLRAAFEDIRMGLVGQLERAAMDDVDTHHQAALSLQLLARVKTTLQRYLEAIAVDKAKEKQDSFLRKMKQMYVP